MQIKEYICYTFFSTLKGTWFIANNSDKHNQTHRSYRSSTSIDFLERYRWSSFPDYMGKRNFPSVTTRGFILDIFGGHEKYRKYMLERLKQIDSEHLLNEVRDVKIE